MATTPEGKVKAKLKARLKTLPEPVYQFWPVQTGMGAATLDCLLCYKGCFHAIETKAPGKHLTPRQEMIANAIREAGGVVFRVDDAVGTEATIAILRDCTPNARNRFESE